MKKLLQRKVLLPVAGLVLAATVVMGREKPAAELIEAARVERKAEPALDLDLSRLDRARVAVASQDGDPFAARNFNPPPPPQQQAGAAQPPPKPEAPPLPFRYIGRLIEDGKTLLFLANGDENLTVHAGQKLGEYRLDGIAEHEIVFTYLPLKTRQSLPL